MHAFEFFETISFNIVELAIGNCIEFQFNNEKDFLTCYQALQGYPDLLPHCDKKTYTFIFTAHQYQCLKKEYALWRNIPINDTYLIKNIAGDSDDLYPRFETIITRSPANQIKIPLRINPKKKFTVTGNGIEARCDKKAQYEAKDKFLFSPSTSTTLVTPRLQPKLFVFSTDYSGQQVAFIFNLKDALLTQRFFISDGNTTIRPYDFDTQDEAEAYYQTEVHGDHPHTLFGNIDSFIQYIESPRCFRQYYINEVLARIKWNNDGTSQIAISQNTLKGRLKAQEYAQRLSMRLKTQFDELAPTVPNLRPAPSPKKIPIVYYLPGSPLHMTLYDIFEQAKDRTLVTSPAIAARFFSGTVDINLIQIRSYIKDIDDKGYFETVIKYMRSLPKEHLLAKEGDPSDTSLYGHIVPRQDNTDLLFKLIVSSCKLTKDYDRAIKSILLYRTHDSRLSALMLAMRTQLKSVRPLVHIIATIMDKKNRQDVKVQTAILMTLDINSHNALMNAASWYPDIIPNLIDLMRSFSKEDQQTMITQVSALNSNALMLAVRYQETAIIPLLKYIQTFDQMTRELIALQISRYRWNLLMLAVKYQPSALDLLFEFIDSTLSQEKINYLLLQETIDGLDLLTIAESNRSPAIMQIMLAFFTAAITTMNSRKTRSFYDVFHRLSSSDQLILLRNFTSNAENILIPAIDYQYEQLIEILQLTTLVDVKGELKYSDQFISEIVERLFNSLKQSAEKETLYYLMVIRALPHNAQDYLLTLVESTSGATLLMLADCYLPSALLPLSTMLFAVNSDNTNKLITDFISDHLDYLCLTPQQHLIETLRELHQIQVQGSMDIIKNLLVSKPHEPSLLLLAAQFYPLLMIPILDAIDILSPDEKREILMQKDSNGKTALMLACEYQPLAVALLLERYNRLSITVVYKDAALATLPLSTEEDNIKTRELSNRLNTIQLSGNPFLLHAPQRYFTVTQETNANQLSMS